jgi:hypothetical protein
MNLRGAVTDWNRNEHSHPVKTRAATVSKNVRKGVGKVLGWVVVV